MKPWWRIEIFPYWAERGSAMIAALFALLILLFVGATAFNFGAFGRHNRMAPCTVFAGSYLAESGIESPGHDLLMILYFE